MLNLTQRGLHHLYPSIDLFRFPYDAGVWGNAADWIMIIVTAFTAYYLIKSFNEQKRANEISYKNYLSTICPIFAIAPEIAVEGDNSFIILTLKENAAYQIECSFFDSEYLFNPKDTYQISNMYPGNQYFFVIAKEINDIFFGQKKIATIVFLDKEKIEYFQDVYFIYGAKPYITDPELMTSL